VDKALADKLPAVQGEPAFPTTEQVDAAKAKLAGGWDAAISG
jgi:putative spermidine/putrescine transport system substrate-binding protein